MTAKQRAQVVELLRCAADIWFAEGLGLGAADDRLGRPGGWNHAVNAWYAAHDSLNGNMAGWSYGDACLEAAARVEEGSHK